MTNASWNNFLNVFIVLKPLLQNFHKLKSLKVNTFMHLEICILYTEKQG